MSPRWRYFLPGYLWALPHTLVGLALAIVYRAHSWWWHQGVLVAIGGKRPDGSTRIWGNPGAQTHGWLLFAASEDEFARRDLRVHEFVHVVQGFVGGPLYMLAYGACFLWAWMVRGFGPWHEAYAANPFERMAYRIGDGADGWGA